MKIKILLTTILLIIFNSTMKSNDVSIIPYPQSVERLEGYCDLSGGVKISGNKKIKKHLEAILSSDLSHVRGGSKIPVEITIDPSSDTNSEAYQLSILPNRITIVASSENGAFYAIQSIRQLIKQNRVPCLRIYDRPAFSWRSYMLDEARYFQGKEIVKKLIDEMALLKFNRFHWHLTNDAGWRIEIKKYPLLTEIGSRRDSTQINDNGKKWDSEIFDGKEHSGFYTQEDIKEIIRYAAERYITIIPEVSMPGHASAAVASYPWLGTSNEQIKVPEMFGVVQTVFNPADERVITFFHDVLKEVSDLFPSDVIHIGGDEVKYDQWKESAQIAQYMEDHNLTNYSDVQVQFTNEISNYISNSLGKKMMGWNEILGAKVHGWERERNEEHALAKLSPDAIVHFWAGTADNLDLAIQKGYNVVNSYSIYTYLDYTYEDISLHKAYSFNPIPEGIEPHRRAQILGMGCQMWGEWTPTNKEIEYQTFPRIAAYAECGWTMSEKKNYHRFKENLQPLITRWENLGYNITPLAEANINEQK